VALEGVEPLKLGIVGCGFVTEHRHLPTLQGLSQVQVAALADIDFDRCRRVADRFGVPERYSSAGALLERPDIDAVAVCAPAAAHAEVALAALEAGKHVFVEKPLTLSLEEADALVERASGTHTVAAVGFNLRCHRLVRQARTLVREGAVGRVSAVATSFGDDRLTRPDLPPWRRKRELGGGALLEKLIHHVDLWRFLLDDEAGEVFAVSRSERGDDEVAMVTGRMLGGALAHAFGSDLTGSSNEVRLYGEEGVLSLDLYRLDGLVRSSLTDLPGSPRTRLRRMLAGAVQLSRSSGDLRRGGAFDATYAAEWRQFAAAVRGNGKPAATFEDGRRALQIVLAAASSATLGSPVAVAEAPQTVTPVA
jgi:myo-inositol 2-dehydrogenase / D-chiro-inositol 1-dehydrogenase